MKPVFDARVTGVRGACLTTLKIPFMWSMGTGTYSLPWQMGKYFVMWNGA